MSLKTFRLHNLVFYWQTAKYRMLAEEIQELKGINRIK